MTDFEKELCQVNGKKRKGELSSPLLMGILNVTPDSFFDGGLHNSNIGKSIAHAKRMVIEGALILDIGGESSRPGAEMVSLKDELDRVIPVITELRKNSFFDRIAISIDTTKAEVAKQAINAGANIVNDISALQKDPDMISIVLNTGAYVVLNHMKGTPTDMQKQPSYHDVNDEVVRELCSTANLLVSQGHPKAKIILDPGIGFGKEQIHNLDLIKNLGLLVSKGYEVLLGVSRKSYIGRVRGLESSDRLQASIATALYGYKVGVKIFRVHDVKATFESLRMWQVIENLEV